jgi:hypothetical protein
MQQKSCHIKYWLWLKELSTWQMMNNGSRQPAQGIAMMGAALLYISETERF